MNWSNILRQFNHCQSYSQYTFDENKQWSWFFYVQLNFMHKIGQPGMITQWTWEACNVYQTIHHFQNYRFVWCRFFENVNLSLHYLFAFYTTLIILEWFTYDVIRISISRIWLCVRFANLLVIYALNFHDRLHISISHYLPHFVLSMKHRFQKYWNWALLFWPSLSNMIGGWIMFGTSCEGQDVGESCPLLILPCKFSNVFRISLKDGRWSASKFQDYE